MMKTDFKRFGVMMDMSRDSVMNLPALKQLLSELGSMGYNTLMLYTEDTYEITDEPYFGHFRGRYSKNELREVVAHCDGLGIEVIPCIQTLAHLPAIFRWPRYARLQDCDDILLAETEETYELIEKMFRSVKECFHSKVVHIGMDEAHKVGAGNYLDRYGYHTRFEILSRHLKRVCEIAKKYDLEPVMWGDMFFRILNHGRYYNVENPLVPTPEEVNLPEEVQITYWDYYHTEESHYEKYIDAHRKLERPLWFAGGIWTWKGFAPDNKFSLRVTRAALAACREKKVENVILTLWGDNGGECPRFSVLPAFYACACYAAGEYDEEKIKADFEAKYGIAFDDFVLLDMKDKSEGVTAAQAVTNPEKYLLYNDPFLGVCDSTLEGNEMEFYTSLAEKMAPLAENARFGYLFRTEAKLAEILSRKAALGERTRAAYQARDRKALEELLADYRFCEEKLDEFLRIFRAGWLVENKPNGLEVHEIRIGGALARIRSCRERLALYLEGGAEIPELDEKPLDLMGGGEVMAHKHVRYPVWGKAATVAIK